MAAEGEAEWFAKTRLAGQFCEGVLQTVANDHDDFINAPGALEALPGVGDERTSGHCEEELVHIGSHAGAPAGGDDDGGVHGGSVWPGGWGIRGEIRRPPRRPRRNH